MKWIENELLKNITYIPLFGSLIGMNGMVMREFSFRSLQVISIPPKLGGTHIPLMIKGEIPILRKEKKNKIKGEWYNNKIIYFFPPFINSQTY